jgi:hypothetical protein
VNNAAAAMPMTVPATLPVNAAAAIPCADYPVNPIPAQCGVAHVNLRQNWWDTTTVPLPWVNTPYTPPTIIPWVQTTGSATLSSYTTQEQKAELVLAVLLNVLMGKSYVELANRVVRDWEQKTIEFVYQETGLLIRVPKNMLFSEIVNALYDEFGNLRGKQIR